MNEDDKFELVFFLTQKLFCIGQNQYGATQIHTEYLTTVELLCKSSIKDREVMIAMIGNLFKGRHFF
jgi:hypothetical protein